MQFKLNKTGLDNPVCKNILVIALGGILALLLLDFPYIPVIICFGFIVFLLYAKSPLAVLGLLVFFLPYSGTVLFNTRFIDIPGAKLLNLIALLVLLIAAINYKESVKLYPYAFYFSAAMIVLFSISFVRSLPHLEIFSYYWEENLSIPRYFLSYFLKPIIFFIPFIIIGKYVYKREHIDYIIGAITWSIIVFSIFIISMYLFKCPYKANITMSRRFFEPLLGLHTNGIACFYIITFPIMFARFFLKKNFITILGICLSCISVGLLYSRTAYALSILSIMLYLVISKRSRFFPIFFIILAILILVLPGNIKERTVAGLYTKNINKISAGRVENIWMPLIREYFHDPEKLIIGNGRYGILSSKAFAKRAILNVDVSHNMYLEQILDCGLIGLAIFLYFFTIIGKKIYSSFHKIRNKRLREYQYAAFTTLIAHLISGITGRSFFPELQNIFLWVILGYSICIIRIAQNSRQEDVEGRI